MDAVSVVYTCEYSRVGVPCIPSHGCSRPYSHPPPLLMPSVLPSGTKKERCSPVPAHLLACPALRYSMPLLFRVRTALCWPSRLSVPCGRRAEWLLHAHARGRSKHTISTQGRARAIAHRLPGGTHSAPHRRQLRPGWRPGGSACTAQLMWARRRGGSCRQG